MKDILTYNSTWNIVSGYNVAKTWNINETLNDGYPFLSWARLIDLTLPVTLSSFTATYTLSNSVKIQWTTQSENNMMGYHILRADTNNLIDAQRISYNFITANNLSTEYNYAFSDSAIAENTEYYYWLMSIELDGTIKYHGSVYVKTNNIIVSPPPIPKVNQLKSAYPNPFNPSTTISFDLVKPETVKIDIYNIKGQLVKTLTHKMYETGLNSILWDGKDSNQNLCATGVYFYRMKAGKATQTKKMMIVK